MPRSRSTSGCPTIRSSATRTVYLAPVPAGGTVTLAWGDRPSFPADEDGIGLVITQFRADIGPETFEK